MELNTFTLTLTDAEINQIGQLLTQAPWFIANPLLVKIQEQVAQQQQAPPTGDAGTNRA